MKILMSLYLNTRENKLTEIKKRLVEKDTLANCIYNLGLADVFDYGNGDQKNNVQESHSVMEDLFEAILGAEAIDSNYDISRIQDSVMVMLNPKAIIFENKINYIQESSRLEPKKNWRFTGT